MPDLGIPADRDKRIEEIRSWVDLSAWPEEFVTEELFQACGFLLAALDEERERADKAIRQTIRARTAKVISEFEAKWDDADAKANHRALQHLVNELGDELDAAEVRASSWQQEAEAMVVALERISDSYRYDEGRIIAREALALFRERKNTG